MLSYRRFFYPCGLAAGVFTTWWLTGSPVDLLRVGASRVSASGAPVTSAPARAAAAVRRAVPVRLIAVGDLMLGTDVQHRLPTHGPSYPFDRAAAVLSSADVTFGNLETPLTGRGAPTPGKNRASVAAGRDYLFRAPVGFATGLAGSGFDIVSLANNHTMDYQGTGLLDTIRVLKSAGISTVGAGRNSAEAHAPVVVQRPGVRIGFIGISDILPRQSVASKSSAGIAAAPRGSDRALAASILKLKRDTDHVVVAVHWGVERATQPSARQRALGRRLIQMGANVVIGSHPHVLQPVERYRGGVIHYSLGNFVTYIGKRQPTEAIEVLLKTGAPARYRRIPFTLRDGQAVPTT